MRAFIKPPSCHPRHDFRETGLTLIFCAPGRENSRRKGVEMMKGNGLMEKVSGTDSREAALLPENQFGNR